jgi:hypothetical protein
MSKRLIVAAAAVLLVSSPAFAATTYYVGHKPNSASCSVMTKKPDGKTSIMAGTTTYKTSASAKAAIKTLPDCK